MFIACILLFCAQTDWPTVILDRNYDIVLSSSNHDGLALANSQAIKFYDKPDSIKWQTSSLPNDITAIVSGDMNDRRIVLLAITDKPDYKVITIDSKDGKIKNVYSFPKKTIINYVKINNDNDKLLFSRAYPNLSFECTLYAINDDAIKELKFFGGAEKCAFANDRFLIIDAEGKCDLYDIKTLALIDTFTANDPFIYLTTKKNDITLATTTSIVKYVWAKDSYTKKSHICKGSLFYASDDIIVLYDKDRNKYTIKKIAGDKLNDVGTYKAKNHGLVKISRDKGGTYLLDGLRLITVRSR